jgi:hypothetical protein
VTLRVTFVHPRIQAAAGLMSCSHPMGQRQLRSLTSSCHGRQLYCLSAYRGSHHCARVGLI